jgi:hypothetical protein
LPRVQGVPRNEAEGQCRALALSPPAAPLLARPDDLRKQLDIRKPRESDFSKDDVRSWALKILESMAQLSQHERRRVLQHAMKVNGV